MTEGFFESKYREAFSQLGFTISPEDGIKEPDIVIQEQSLGIKLPKSLRSYYLIAGNHVLSRVANKLYTLEELHIWTDYLVFMREDRELEHWGMPLDKLFEIDPPVYAGLEARFIEPYSQEKICSDFLILNVFSQAISGGFEHYGEGHIKLSYAKTIQEKWRNIGDGFYASEGKIVYFADENFKKDETILVTIAARTEKDFISLVWDISAKLSQID